MSRREPWPRKHGRPDKMISSQVPLPRLRAFGTARLTVTAPTELTDVSTGVLRVVPIVGGHFQGDGLTAEILTGGADRQVVHPDGSASINAVFTMRDEHDNLFDLCVAGHRHGPPDVLRELATGKAVDPSRYYFKTTVKIQTTAHGREWMNRTIVVANATKEGQEVVLELFALE